jgi:hypothetical protein
MVAYTTKMRIPYVTTADPVGSYYTRDKEQADRMETLRTTPGTYFYGGLTGAAGWAIGGETYLFYGGLLSFYISFSRSGAPITVGGTGDISNQTIGTFDASLFKFLGYGPMTTTSDGRGAMFYIANNSLAMHAVGGQGVSIATDEYFAINGIALVEWTF